VQNNLKSILGFVGVMLIAFCLWYLRTIVAYVLLAGVLSFIGSPLTNFFDNIKFKKFDFPRSVAAAITLLVMIGAIVGFISLFAPLIALEAQVISSIKVDDVLQNLDEPIAQVEVLMGKYNITANTDTDYLQNKITELVNLSNITNIFSNIFGTLGNIFIAFFSISFICFFFLKEEGLFHQMLISFSPKKYVDKVKKILSNTKHLLTRYFIGILIQTTIIAIIISGGLAIIGVKNALIIGVFAGIINIIPYVGPIIGAMVGIVLSITTNLELDFYYELMPMAFKICVLFASMQMLDNFLLQPIIFSNSVNAHPLEIFLVILIAGTVAGISGMIFAIPFYTFIRIIAKEFLSQFEIVKSLTKNI